MKPIKIVCIKYESDSFEPFYGSLGFFNTLIILMCSNRCKCTIYEFEGVYDP